MKMTILLILLLNSLSVFSNDTLVFGEWFVNGAVCTINERYVDCPKLSQKVKITKNVSSCNGFEIKITPILANEAKPLFLNECKKEDNEINLFPTGYGYHYYNIERLKSGLDIVLSGSSDFLEIYIYSSSIDKGSFSRTYFLSKNIIP